MSYYRIYRPLIIPEIDNVSIRTQLQVMIKKDRQDLPHAYLFSGIRGSGKTTAARLLAKLFTCTGLSKSEGPCGKCAQCLSIASGTNMDVLEIDAASNRGIDEIRTIRERIGLAPALSEYTVYIIDEVHMLTTEAFNALLKTLEEPPPHVVFILATTDISKVPETIRSRCLSIVFQKASFAELKNALERVVASEKLKIDQDALTEIIRQAEGSFRDGVKLLEQAALSTDIITVKSISETLALSDRDQVGQFLGAAMEGNVVRGLDVIASVVNSGVNIKTFQTEILRTLERAVVTQLRGSPPETGTGAGNPSRIKHFIRLLIGSYAHQRHSPIPELPLELALIDFCADYPPDSVRPAIAADRKPEVTAATAIPDTVPAESHTTKNNQVVGVSDTPVTGSLSVQRLNDCWKDIIEELKPLNHSIAGVLRSTRPKSVSDGVVGIEAFYKFHQEKLSEPKVKEILTGVFKKLFGEKVKIEISLGKK